jgi:hypothetical protein
MATATSCSVGRKMPRVTFVHVVHPSLNARLFLERESRCLNGENGPSVVSSSQRSCSVGPGGSPGVVFVVMMQLLTMALPVSA